MSGSVDVRGGIIVSGLMDLLVQNAPSGSYALPVDVASLLITPTAITLTGPSPPYTFDDWLAEPYVDRVVLAEMQPSERLTTWTALGGTTPNVYSTPFPAFVATDATPGGVYRQLDSVAQNGVALATAASITACQSTPGSYHLASGLLYVHTTTSVHPRTIAALAATFTLCVGTAPLDFPEGRLYEPHLAGSLPTVSATAEDGFQAIKAYAAGSVDLVNAHGLYDAISRGFVWRNKAITLFLGGGALSRPQYEQVATLRIDSLTVADDTARLSVRSQASLLEQTVPFATLTRSEYPALGEGLEGTYQPLLYGAVRSIPGLLVNGYAVRNPGFTGAPGDFADVYLLADPDRQALSAVSSVRARHRTTGELRTLDASAFSVVLSACTVTVLDATFRSDEWAILVDATGPAGTDTAAQIARDLLLQLGERPAAIDTASFAALDAVAAWPLACWLREPVEASAVFAQIQQSVMGAFWIGRDGMWRARALDLAVPIEPRTLEDADFVAWQPVDRIEPVYPIVRVYYAREPSLDGGDLLTQYDMVSAEDAAVRYLYETGAGLSVRTFLRDRTAATNMAQRYRSLTSVPETQIDAELRGVDMMTADLFDAVRVTRGRAPGGAYVAQRMDLVGIEKRLDPVRVRVRLSDRGGVRRLDGGLRDVSNASVTWGTSTATQQATLAYISNDDGEVSAGVPNPTILW